MRNVTNHGEVVFERIHALVKDFDDRCEKGRNGMVPSPSQTMARAILKALNEQRTALVAEPAPQQFSDAG